VKWFVALVRSGSETDIIKWVGRRGVEAYEPMARRLQRDKRHHDRYRMVVEPLLRGYLFIALAPDPWGRFPFGRITDCEQVFRFISFEGVPFPIPEGLIADLRARESRGEFDKTVTRKGKVRTDLAPFPDWVEEGKQVLIKAGPFRDFFGTVLEAMSFSRIRIETELLGRKVDFELPLDDIGGMA
jgi:transcription antitermination factor NusG